MTTEMPEFIPKPLVRFNQFVILVTGILGIFWHWVLWIPFIAGLITVLTRTNPIVLMGKPFLKKAPHEYIPEEKDQQIFNQWIATISFGLAILSFWQEWTIAGYIFLAMVLIATGLAFFFDFCLGCTVRYQYQMWKHRRKMKNAQ